MAAGAAEAIIEIEMAEGGVEIVAPHQHDDAPTEPDAFRISGRPLMACAASANSSVLRWLSLRAHQQELADRLTGLAAWCPAPAREGRRSGRSRRHAESNRKAAQRDENEANQPAASIPTRRIMSSTRCGSTLVSLCRANPSPIRRHVRRLHDGQRSLCPAMHEARCNVVKRRTQQGCDPRPFAALADGARSG